MDIPCYLLDNNHFGLGLLLSRHIQHLSGGVYSLFTYQRKSRALKGKPVFPKYRIVCPFFDEIGKSRIFF